MTIGKIHNALISMQERDERVRIYIILKNHGYDDYQIAELFGLTMQTIKKYGKMKADFNDSRVKKIEETLNKLIEKNKQKDDTYTILNAVSDYYKLRLKRFKWDIGLCFVILFIGIPFLFFLLVSFDSFGYKVGRIGTVITGSILGFFIWAYVKNTTV